MMPYTALALAAVMILAMKPLQAAEPIDIELVHGGKRQELSDQARLQIAERLPKLLATCSINSRDHPRIFASWNFATVWDDIEAKDHLAVRLAEIEQSAAQPSVR